MIKVEFWVFVQLFLGSVCLDFVEELFGGINLFVNQILLLVSDVLGDVNSANDFGSQVRELSEVDIQFTVVEVSLLDWFSNLLELVESCLVLLL